MAKYGSFKYSEDVYGTAAASLIVGIGADFVEDYYKLLGGVDLKVFDDIPAVAVDVTPTAVTLGGTYPVFTVPLVSVNVETYAPDFSAASGAAGVTTPIVTTWPSGGFIVGAAPATAGDLFEAPISISTSGTTTVDLLNSTWQTGEPSQNFSNAKTIWLKYPFGQSGILTVSSTESGIPYWMEIFTGTSVGGLTLQSSAHYVSGGTHDLASAVLSKLDQAYIRVSPAGTATQASFDVSYAFSAVASVMTMELKSDTIERAPATVVMSVWNATPLQAVTLELKDGSTVLASTTVTASSDGVVGDTSLSLPAVPSGTYTAVATQGSSSVVRTFTVASEPLATGDPLPSDVPPTTSTQTGVQHWVLEDPATGGLGVYTVPINPSRMTTPWAERIVTRTKTTAPSGPEMYWEAPPGGADWQLEGTILTQAHYDKLNAYTGLNRRIYVRDHRSRVWIVGFREIQWDAMSPTTPWAWTYRISATIFGTLTSLPSAPADDPGSLQAGYDSNGVKMGLPTVSLSGSTLTASATLWTNVSVDFTYLRIAAIPQSAGTAFGIAPTSGTLSGTINLSGTGEVDASGLWNVSVVYSVNPTPASENIVYGPVATVNVPIANSSPGTQPAGTPPSGSGGTSSAIMLGASGDDASSGGFSNWMGKAIAIGGSWSDNSLDNHINAYSIGPGERWGSFTGGMDFAVGGLYQGSGDSWAAAASGSYNSRWSQCITACKNKWGSRDASKFFLSPFREFNLSSSDWKVTGSDATNFKNAFHQFRTVQQSVWPACNLVLTLNDGTSGGLGLDVRNAIPSSADFDIYCIDTYNQYPWVNDSSGFTSKINATDGYGAPIGIEVHRQLAQSLGKPLGISEWSNNGVPASDTGGGEATTFIQLWYDYLMAHAGNGSGQIIYAVLFNLWTQFQFWPTTKQPATAAKWKSVAGG